MALIKCNECGADVSDKATSCPNCGANIVIKKKCPECGKQVEKGDMECPNCGFSFSSLPKGLFYQSRNFWIMIGIILFVMVVIIIVVINSDPAKKMIGRWENEAGVIVNLQDNGACVPQGATPSGSIVVSYEDCTWSLNDRRVVITTTVKLSLGTNSQVNKLTVSGLVNSSYDEITMDEGSVYTKE